MSRRKGPATEFDGIEYERVPDNRDDFIDSQFESPKRRIPYKALGLATFLCVGGTILLTFGSLLVSGYIDIKYADRTWPLIILGALMFLPGSYHVRIAYCAFREYPGYSFDDIPEFD